MPLGRRLVVWASAGTVLLALAAGFVLAAWSAAGPEVAAGQWPSAAGEAIVPGALVGAAVDVAAILAALGSVPVFLVVGVVLGVVLWERRVPLFVAFAPVLATGALVVMTNLVLMGRGSEPVSLPGWIVDAGGQALPAGNAVAGAVFVLSIGAILAMTSARHWWSRVALLCAPTMLVGALAIAWIGSPVAGM